MRISTPLLYQQGISAITDQQRSLVHLQQQIATGRHMLTAADDPVAASEALSVRQSKSENDQYATNIGSARDLLNQNDSLLSTIAEVLQSVRTTAIAAGNAPLSTGRDALAQEVKSRLEQLVGLANSRDANGNFIFAGYRNDAPPFSGGGGAPVVYNGDQGVKTVQVSPTRFVDATQNGFAIFENVPSSNGPFAVTSANTNTGTGLIGTGTVANGATLTGDTYRVQFNVAGGTTTYDVIDTTTSTTLSTGNAYVDGGPITVSGMSFSITGAPASGDQFTLQPAGKQSIFATLQKLIDTLNTPTTTSAQRTSFTNALNAAVQNLDQGLESVLAAHADVGANLRELDALSQSSEDRGVLYSQSLSRLEDLDYNSALSLFAQQQLALEAAQKSFLKVSGLSLFAFM